MDPHLVLIFGFVVVVFTIIMTFVAATTKRQLRLKEKQLDLDILQASGGSAPVNDGRLDNMEQRLRVLERIATDSGSNVSADLAREIEALWHEQDVADSGVPIDLKEKVR